MMNYGISDEHYTIGEIISTAWQVFWANRLKIFCIICVVYLPINAILSFVPVEHLIDEYGLRGFRIYLKIVQLLEALIGVLATMSLVRIIEAELKGISITWEEALKFSLSRWGSLIYTNILAGLILMGLFICFIIPGIIWAIYYTFVVYVVATKGISGKEALDYSKALVQGQWWRICGYNFVINMLALSVSILIGVVSIILPEITVLEIITDTLSDFLFSLFTCMSIVFFFNNDLVINKPEYEEPEEEMTISPEIEDDMELV